MKFRIWAIVILIFGIGISFFVFQSEPSLRLEQLPAPASLEKPFRLGLDLSGGTHLVYRADLSSISLEGKKDSMDSLRDLIERRVNIFGVAEPNVQIQRGNFINQNEERLIVDLPGVTDINQAVEMIGQTPVLEFKTENPNFNPKDLEGIEVKVGDDGQVILPEIDIPVPYLNTGLTGQHLKTVTLEFDQYGQPKVSLVFNQEGSDLFEKITKENIGKTVAIYLDGYPLSTPVVNETISGGKAQITGVFTPEEAKLMVGRMKQGALPVSIELISTQTIGPSLGGKAITDGVKSAMVGFLLVALFFLLWYRLPGLIAIVALIIYSAIMFTVFKLIPVTLTAAGIAGFIISIGIAVDANILIFERIKEELKEKAEIKEAIKNGFSRAWLSIRDSNLSSIISAFFLFLFGSSLVKGFALIFGIGVLVSMISAITISRVLLLALDARRESKIMIFLFNSGIK